MLYLQDLFQLFDIEAAELAEQAIAVVNDDDMHAILPGQGNGGDSGTGKRRVQGAIADGIGIHPQQEVEKCGAVAHADAAGVAGRIKQLLP